jgi:glutamyl-tRNA synthetase
LVAEVRVRYAPSPTGQPHIGNIRTALFNWLFARHHGGKFIVRVEDTDQNRLVEGAVDAILDGLRWLNIDWDEGPEVDGPHAPYVQSQRLEVYQRLTEQLLDQGNAYYCYCSREELERLRRTNRGSGAGNGCNCRRQGRAGAAGQPVGDDDRVVRFAMPESGVTQVHDLIRGDVEWRNELQEDFVILKSDGFPTYHLAVVTDDHLMEISHVMRAEEWLPSTPRHLQLNRAFGFQPPEFAHLPMITGPDRAKLSKRHGATAIGEYREQGYLPEALLNFMVLLGWSLDGSTEVVSLQNIVDNFTLDRITKSAAIFDQDKLMWMNGVYIRDLPPDDLSGRMASYIPKQLDADEQDYLCQIAPLVQERLKRLDESDDMTAYFFGELAPQYDAAMLVQKGMDSVATLAALNGALAALNANTADGDFGHEKLESLLGETGQRLELSRRQFFGLLRTAATGRTVSPPLFETMEVMGRERILARLRLAAQKMSTVA